MDEPRNLNASMATTPDILVYSPDRQLQAVVEVKNRRDAGEDWAMRFRRNLLAHRLIPRAEYFLLIFPDTLYLWRGADVDRPSAQVPTPEALGRFVEALPDSWTNESSLELVVSSWLRTLTGTLPDEESGAGAKWLVDTGLYDRIRGGYVERSAA